jgi:hypothetical protein
LFFTHKKKFFAFGLFVVSVDFFYFFFRHSSLLRTQEFGSRYAPSLSRSSVVPHFSYGLCTLGDRWFSASDGLFHWGIAAAEGYVPLGDQCRWRICAAQGSVPLGDMCL